MTTTLDNGLTAWRGKIGLWRRLFVGTRAGIAETIKQERASWQALRRSMEAA